MIDKGQWREFGQDTGVTPLLFTRSAMGFLMTTESQDLGLSFSGQPVLACMYGLNNNLMFGSDLERRYTFYNFIFVFIIGLGIFNHSIIKGNMMEITEQQNWTSSEMS